MNAPRPDTFAGLFDAERYGMTPRPPERPAPDTRKDATLAEIAAELEKLGATRR